ncbi:hypothetical protein GOP47_0007423 [Adiantum capillus-veneris]|uniref:Uncharacterized protein n=1 Tax=Adiantum capillus-veneris TaxID=13818 RepID=A0A9D4V100_ADICA|nr:hypothetical protein GOP47_0007423 [Adiantum capillus-veneris]
MVAVFENEAVQVASNNKERGEEAHVKGGSRGNLSHIGNPSPDEAEFTPHFSRKVNMVRMKKAACSVGASGDASASLVRRGRPRKTEEELLAAESRRPKRLFELSITISVGGADVDTGLLPVLKEFLEKETIAGICSIKHGGTVFHLHFQMVMRITSTSIIAVNKKVKTYLGWDRESPVGATVLCRALKQKNMHTFQGMIGYCLKDVGKDHFENVGHNISPHDINKGIELDTLHGADDLKNKVCLTNTNVFDRAFMYWKYSLNHPFGHDFLGTLHRMIKSGKYYPSSTWITPYQGHGMEQRKIAVVWKCMAFPSTVTYNDILDIFVLQGATHPRLDWFLNRWQNTEREEGENKATNEVVNISDSDDDDIDVGIGSDFIPLLKRTKTDVRAMESTEAAVEAKETQMDLSQLDSVYDAVFQRLEDILMQIWRQLRGGNADDNDTLRACILKCTQSVKDTLQDVQLNAADVQFVDMQQQINALSREIVYFKSQLNRLNAIVVRLGNIASRNFRS